MGLTYVGRLFLNLFFWICLFQVQGVWASSCNNICGPKSVMMSASKLQACEIEIKLQDCEKFEPAEYRRNCCDGDMDQPLFLNTSEQAEKSLKACYQDGVVAATQDFVKWLDGKYQKILEQDKQNSLCDLKCKRELTKGDPHFDKMSDSYLAKESIVTIQYIFNERKIALQKHEQSMKAMYFDPRTDPRVLASQRNQKSIKENPPLDYQKMAQTLWQVVQAKAKLEVKRYQCMKPEYYDKVLCYTLMEMIDPVMAAGLVAKTPALSKYAFKQIEKVLSDEKRNLGVFEKIFKRSTPRSSLERELLAERYLNRDFTTVKQREDWIARADASKPGEGDLYFDTENSVLKELNDTLKDKNFVTSLNNKYAEIMDLRMKALQEKYKDQVDFLNYSDYKSYRSAMIPKLPLKAVPKELEKDLAETFSSANQEFNRFLKNNDLIRDADDASGWMRAGIGETADSANIAARTSRDLSGPNQLQNFSDSRISSNLRSVREYSEGFREQLAKKFEGTPLFEKTSSGVNIPHEDVFDVLRKNSHEKDIKQALIDKFASHDPKLKAQLEQQLDENTVHKLVSYKKIVDHFSPGIRSAERKITSLEGADFGGMTADFAGLGAKNLKSTAEGLARSVDLPSSLQNVRAAEHAVTESFLTDAKKFDDVVKKYMPQTVASGDDFAATAIKPLLAADKQKMVNELAAKGGDSQKRIAFIGAKVDSKDRNLLATHGESIEKELRSSLEKKLEPQKLKKLLFAIDMKGSSAGNGAVDLVIGKPSEGWLTAAEYKEIKSTFDEAVKKFNAKPDADGLRRRYSAP